MCFMSPFFWDVMSRHWVTGLQRLGTMCCFHFQGSKCPRRVILWNLDPLSRDHYVFSKRREPVTQWRGITSHKTEISTTPLWKPRLACVQGLYRRLCRIYRLCMHLRNSQWKCPPNFVNEQRPWHIDLYTFASKTHNRDGKYIREIRCGRLSFMKELN